MTTKLTVLFDLDDTLLGNDMDIFMPGYLSILSASLPDIPINTLTSELMTGIKKMMKKTNFLDTLEDVFNNHFYPAIGATMEDLQAPLDHLYQDRFPTLQTLTTSRPEARMLISEIQNRGYPMVVATNPVFPRVAQLQRLCWAGFPNADTIFQDISSFEFYHFSKPHPEYFAEILLRNNLWAYPVVMIGNDLVNDILPAEQLGITTFWINEAGIKNDAQSVLSSAGTLSDILPWLEQITERIKPLSWNQTLSQIITNLNTTPAVFDSLVMNKTPIINQNQSAKWNLCNIIQHLVDGDKQVNIPRIRQFYQEKTPYITSMDLDKLSNTNQCPDDVQQILSQFFFTRFELISLIKNAPDEVLQKKGIHTIFGPTSFIDIVDFIAIHDRNHIKQAIDLRNAPAELSEII